MSSTPGIHWDTDPWPVPAHYDLIFLDAVYTPQWLELHIGLNKYFGRYADIQIFIDSDRDPMTGDTYFGSLRGYEFRVDVKFLVGEPVAFLQQLPDGVGEGDYFRQYSQGPGNLFGWPELNISNQLPMSPYVYSGFPEGDILVVFLPLSVQTYDGGIVDFSNIDIVAVGYPGSGAGASASHGDRAPNYGVFNTQSKTWEVGSQPSQIHTTFDNMDGSLNFGIGLERFEFIIINDQVNINMEFVHDISSNWPSFSLVFDSDRSLTTGQISMGGAVPSFGGDLAFDFNPFGAGYAAVKYTEYGNTQIFELAKGSRSLDDVRWNISENVLSIEFSSSLLDPYILKDPSPQNLFDPMTVERLAYDGPGPLIAIKPLGLPLTGGGTVLDGFVLDTATGELVAPLSFEPTAAQVFYDPNIYTSLDIQEFSYALSGDNLVMQLVVGSWIPNDPWVTFQIFLDVDQNPSTGHKVPAQGSAHPQPEFPPLGAEYIIEIHRQDNFVNTGTTLTFTDYNQGVPSTTYHDAWVHVSAPLGPYVDTPGTVTLTVPLEMLDLPGDIINVGVASTKWFVDGGFLLINYLDSMAVQIDLGEGGGPPIENQAPIARDDVFNARYGITIGDANVLANDEDPEGDPITVISYGYGGPGELTVYTNGNFEYTPAPGFVGVDTFTYTIADSFGAEATATVSLEVPNQPPIARDDFFNARFGIAIGEANVLANDEDPDGDPIKPVTYKYGGPGQLTLYTSGNFSYAPPTGFFGVDAFTYTIEDSFGAEDSATVRLYVPELLTVGADGVIPLTGSVAGPLDLVRHPFVAALDIDVTGDGTVDAWVALDGDFQGRLLVEADEGATSLRFDGGLGTLVQGTDGPDLLVGRDGHNVFRPGLGADQMAGVGGRNLYYGTLAEHDGNRILDFGPDDVIRITDRALTPDQVTINDGPDGVVLEIGVPGQVDAAITLDGPFEPGWFTLATGAGFSKIAFVADAPADADAGGPVLQAIENLSFALLGPTVAGDGTGENPVLVAGPAHGALTLDGDGRFTYDPDPVFFGVDQLTFRTADGADEATVTLEVLRDQDGDGVPDIRDNAILAHNPDQRDTDGDGYGNVVDPDFDNDGIVDWPDLFYLAGVYGTDDPHADLDGDGIVDWPDLFMLAGMYGGPPGPSYIDFLPPSDDSLLV